MTNIKKPSNLYLIFHSKKKKQLKMIGGIQKRMQMRSCFSLWINCNNRVSDISKTLDLSYMSEYWWWFHNDQISVNCQKSNPMCSEHYAPIDTIQENCNKAFILYLNKILTLCEWNSFLKKEIFWKQASSYLENCIKCETEKVWYYLENQIVSLFLIYYCDYMLHQ